VRLLPNAGKIQVSFTRLCRPTPYEGITGKIRLHLGQRLLCRRRAHIKISKRLSSFARYPDHLKMQPYAVRAIGAIHREGLFGMIHDHMEGQIFAFYDALYSRLPCSQASSIVRPRQTAYSPRFNMSGSFAMLEATRLASSIVICFASMASASVERP
jgi:hypothetical protein